MKKPNVAVIWARFGPYHVTRLRITAEIFRKHGVSLHGIEVAQTDSVYKWSLTDSGDSFFRHTLFNSNYADLSFWKICKEIKKVLDIIDPQAIAINGWATSEAYAALLWSNRRRRIAVLMSESKYDECPRVWWKELIKSSIVRRFHSALVGGQVQAAYARHLGIRGSRIFLGYNAVDNDYFSREAKNARNNSAHLRNQYNLPSHYFYANTRFLVRKNIDSLLHAYAAYRKITGKKAWGLVITGSGEVENDLKLLASELGLHEVRWPGFVQYQDLPVYYGLASAFIHPAKSEPWGLVINEAAAAGLPLLVSQTVGACYELLHDSDNGYVLDPFNIADITQKLLMISEVSAEQRIAMGKCSRLIVSDYGPERFASGLQAAIKAGQNAVAYKHTKIFE